MGSNERYASLAGRILIAVIFLLSGLGKLGNWGGTASMMASKGLPAVQLLLGDEAVAQHEVERDAPEQVVVDPEVRHVDELQTVAEGERLG